MAKTNKAISANLLQSLISKISTKVLSVSSLTDEQVETLIYYYFFLDREVEARHASFDLCFLYFQSHRGHLASTSINMENSCMHLWSYLASWGMFRNSKLSKHSPAVLKPLMRYLDMIKSSPIWSMDLNNYNKTLVLQIFSDITTLLSAAIRFNPTVTLVTKIMLGIFGCIPAFDQNFRKAFRNITDDSGNSSNFQLCRDRELSIIINFYVAHKSLFDHLKGNIDVLNINGKKTAYKYTIAKLIDMFGFASGILL